MVSASRPLYSFRLRYVFNISQIITTMPSVSSEGSNAQHNMVAAQWVPDDKSDTCMHCRSTKFSTYNRKHVWVEWMAVISEFWFDSLQHCRNCGHIVCEGCSKKRFLLPHLDAKAVRVCDSCYAKLNTNDKRGKCPSDGLTRGDFLSRRSATKSTWQ